MGKRLRHWAEYAVFRLVVAFFGMLSPRGNLRVAKGLAWFIHDVLPGKLTRSEMARHAVEEALCVSEREATDIVRNMWIHLFRMIAEIVQLPRKIRTYNVADMVRYRNRPATLKTLCSGRPVIMLGGHFGNWEVATVTFSMFGFPMGVVARDLDNPHLHRWFKQYRESTGSRLISKTGASQEVLECLSHRGFVGLAGDQDAGKKGIFAEFFGKPASTFKSIALTALENRAYIVVGYARRLPDDFENDRWVRFELGTEAIIDPLEYEGIGALSRITQDFTTALEKAVRRSPEQYFWVHRRWKTPPRMRRTESRRAA